MGDIHRIFSQIPINRSVPRLFVFDCCSGMKDREQETRLNLLDGSTETGTADKAILRTATSLAAVYSSRVKNDVSVRFEDEEWGKGEANPDHLMALVHASNPGYRAKMTTIGSFLIKNLLDGLRENPDSFLYSTINRIQRQLHDGNEQLITKEFTGKRNTFVLCPEASLCAVLWMPSNHRAHWVSRLRDRISLGISLSFQKRSPCRAVTANLAQCPRESRNKPRSNHIPLIFWQRISKRKDSS